MKKTKIYRSCCKYMPLLISAGTLIILIIGSISYINSKQADWEKEVKSHILEILMTKKISLEKALYSRIHYTKSVAAYVSFNPDLTDDEFHNLAHELINGDSVISSMAISKNCILNAIYPMKGHESAIGLDLLAHPERKEIVEKTIETHKSFIAGPVELIEGGIAFISYTPIFDNTNGHPGTFWGVTDIVIYKDELLKQSKLKKQQYGFDFALRGFNGLGNDGAIWWGDTNVFHKNPLKVDIDLPYGNWVLAAIPEVGWYSYLHQDNSFTIFLYTSAFVISILVWLFSRAMVKIRRNEKELTAIFNSLDSLIFVFDNEGRYIKIPQINSELLYKPIDELLGKTVYEVFPEDKAKLFHNAILECLRLKRLIEFEYSLQISGKKNWFLARISWESEKSVIFHSIDITNSKNIREKIISSEKRLGELNATKDKFFSIIAHDLRSPFNVILGYSDLLNTEYDEIEEEDRRKLINSIDKSSKNTYKLLQNLLSWAESQRNNIKIENQNLNLKNCISEAIAAYIPLAEKKNINIEINIAKDIEINADKFTISSIIGNLFNNAIKFTYPKGHIEIACELKDDFAEIRVTDNGVGIPTEIIPKLFQIEESVSTLSTDNEKGTGLGLILCKEYIEKINGKIWVESELGKGSTFFFTIPN
ncbi:MAG: CHASE domain-containing protein [Saprospiraceae bacterium]|nr:CHASE domain-containing protein [Saprospiraceae bacterium]